MKQRHAHPGVAAFVAANQARYVSTVQDGIRALTRLCAATMTAESVFDLPRWADEHVERYCLYLDAIERFDSELRDLFDFEGCVFGEQGCPNDAPASCLGCAREADV